MVENYLRTILCALSLAVLFFLGSIAYSDNPSARIEAASSKSEVFVSDEIFTVKIHIANLGTTDLSPFSSQCVEFKDQWVVDDPRVAFSDSDPWRHDLLCPDASRPNTISILKSGQEFNDTINLVLVADAHANSPIMFRLGFKNRPDSPPIWSNFLKISIKKENKPFPVKIGVIAQTTTIRMSEHADVSVTLSNPKSVSQDIGSDCDLKGEGEWLADNKAIVISGGPSCEITTASADTHGRIILKPNEGYMHGCTVIFNAEMIRPGRLTFRIGFKRQHYLPAWSNTVTLNILPE